MAFRKTKEVMVGLVPPWGHPGTPLLPSRIRGALATEPLPRWIRNELGLFPTATLGALGRQALKRGRCSPRVVAFVRTKVRANFAAIAPLRAIPRNWPEGLNHNHISWSRRTRNCLVRAGLISEAEAQPRCPQITFGELMSLRGMGVAALLDFSCLAEAAIEQVAGPEGARVDLSTSGDQADLEVLWDVIDCDWADQVSPQDPRFSDLLPANNEDLTVLELIDSFTAEPEQDATEITFLAAVVPALRRRLRAISQVPLDVALGDLARRLSGLTDRRLEALLARLGWSGKPPVTLAEAGCMVNVTRERMRQLERRTLERMPDHPVFMPTLDVALNLVTHNTPMDLEGAANILQHEGVTSRPFDPRSLLAAAEACGRSPAFELETIHGHMRVVTSRLGERAGAIISIGNRQAEASGASNVQEVLAEALAQEVETDEEEVREVLESFSSVEFLDKDWFWRLDGKPARNRLRNLTRKMLSVAKSGDLGSIREGLRREFKFRGSRGVSEWPLTVPPRSILALLYAKHPEFVIHGDVVSTVSALDYRSELRRTEITLVDVLRSASGQVLDRASCVRGCVARGLNENTLSLYLTYSCLISHLGTDLWSVRGGEVDPVVVEAVRRTSVDRTKERRVLDHGWSNEGRLWAAARLPSIFSNFVFGIPSAIKEYVSARDFAAVDESGNPCGKIAVTSDGVSYGYGSFLRRRGGDQDDILVVEFDLVELKAVLELGDENLLEAKAAGS